MNMEFLKDNLINLIYHNSPDGIFIIDSYGVIVNCNKTIESYYGYACEELMGSHISRILSIHQESLFKEKFAKLQNLEPVDAEIKITRKDGEIMDIWRKAVPIADEQNKHIGVVVFDRDISNRKQTEHTLKQSEELFKTMVDSCLDALIAINSTGKVIMFNPAAEKLFLCQKEKIMGSFPHCIMPNEYINRHDKGVEQYFSSGKAKSLIGKTIELPAKRGDGTLFDIEISFCHGKIDSEDIIISMARDISIHKKAKRKLFDAKIKVEESERLKTTFLANMTHEIRTPLNHILGFSEMLNFAVSNEERNAFIEQINKSSNHLLDIVNDIIHISKIESKVIGFENSSFSIDKLLKKVHSTFSQEKKCTDNKIALSYNKPKKQTYDTIYADKTKLLHVLTNLLKNAFKFTKEGEIDFGYTIERYGDKKHWQFYVKDTGIGVHASKKKTIFNSFMQADNSNTKSHGGIGLGLTIAKKQVDLHNGHIWVESTIGKGSVFYFTIPFNDKQSEQINRLPEKTFKDKKWFNKKILVVDDNENNRFLLKTILSQKGADTITATSGQQAIDICGKLQDIDLVLMDIRMPEMDGYEATRKIKKIHKEVPIIAQTAFSTIKELNDCFDSGCDDFITKPISRKQLFSVISDYF